MSQPQDIESGTSSHWIKRAKRRFPTWLNCRILTLGLIVLVISVGFLAGSLRIVKVEDDHVRTHLSTPFPIRHRNPSLISRSREKPLDRSL